MRRQHPVSSGYAEPEEDRVRPIEVKLGDQLVKDGELFPMGSNPSLYQHLRLLKARRIV